MTQQISDEALILHAYKYASQDFWPENAVTRKFILALINDLQAAREEIQRLRAALPRVDDAAEMILTCSDCSGLFLGFGNSMPYCPSCRESRRDELWIDQIREK